MVNQLKLLNDQFTLSDIWYMKFLLTFLISLKVFIENKIKSFVNIHILVELVALSRNVSKYLEYNMFLKMLQTYFVFSKNVTSKFSLKISKMIIR